MAFMWNTIKLTMILNIWWERSRCEVCLGYVYKYNESLIGVDILRNEISVWARLGDCENMLHAWPVYPKERIFLHVRREAKTVLQRSLVGMKMEKLFLSICWLTILKMAGYTKARLALWFGNYLWADSKMELYRSNVHCKKLPVWGSRYLVW
jgi:hypothetical protein